MTEKLHPGLGSGALREAQYDALALMQAVRRRVEKYQWDSGDANQEATSIANDIIGVVKRALSLSSPIEPPQSLATIAKLCAEDINCINFNRGHVLGDIRGEYDHVMPTEEMAQVIECRLQMERAQASSEVREKLKLIKSCAEDETASDGYRMAMADAHRWVTEALPRAKEQQKELRVESNRPVTDVL